MLKQLHLDQCDSTQDELERHLEGLAPKDFLLVSTDQQLQGRGRGAHTWDHQAGALAFSFSCPPHPVLTWQSLEVAVCLAEFCKQQFGVAMDLKWPNDLYRHEKKAGGILLKHRGSTMLIGIGLNLLPTPLWGHLLDSGDRLPKSWQRELPAQFVRYYMENHPMDVNDIKNQWCQACLHMDKEVRILDGDQLSKGTFIGLGDHGEAILRSEQSEVNVFNGTLRWKN